MRGDRPRSQPLSPLPPRATPHARGSTRDTQRPGDGAHGYPACAGIDLAMEKRAEEGRRLPRMRGDRPHTGRLVVGAKAATPHARGSTREGEGSARHAGGYPACAGIDPCIGGGWMSTSRLPRMRGDRPGSGLPWPSIRTATPHARGATPAGSAFLVGLRGYPACAGIDPPF